MDIVWIGMAFVFGMLLSRIKLPPVVRYLSAGASAVCIPITQAGQKLAELS